MARTDVRVVLTCRTTQGLPGYVVRAWREGLISQTVIPPLDRPEVEEIARGILNGRNLDPETVTRLEQVSGGNPLYLIELVKALDRTGELENRQDIWVWRTPFPEHTTVTDIIRAELSQLSAPARKIFEVISLSAPVRVELLGPKADFDALQELEEHGFIEARQNHNSGSMMVSLSHPIYGEAAATVISRIQTLERFGDLFQNAVATFGPHPDPADVLRVVSWGLNGSQYVPLDLLVRAFRLTHTLADYEFRVRIASALIQHQEVSPELATWPRSAQRSEFAILLGTLASDAFVLQEGNWEEGLRVLDEAADLLQPSEDGSRLEISRAVTLSFAGRMAESHVLQEGLYLRKKGSPDLLPLASTTLITLAQRGQSKQAQHLGGIWAGTVRASPGRMAHRGPES